MFIASELCRSSVWLLFSQNNNNNNNNNDNNQLQCISASRSSVRNERSLVIPTKQETCLHKKYGTSGNQFVDSYFSGITNVCRTTSRLNTGKQERRVAAADEETAANVTT